MATLLNTLGAFLKFDASGNVAWESTLAGVRTAIHTEIEASRADDAEIEKALDRYFDKLPEGKMVKTPSVVSRVASILADDDLELSMEWEPKVAAFIDRCPRFASKRGKGGGMTRIAKPTTPTAAPATVNESTATDDGDEDGDDLDLDSL